MRGPDRRRSPESPLEQGEAEPSRPATVDAKLPLLMALSAAAIAAIFLWLYVRNPTPVPVGFDTPKYVWRANLVAEEGLDALPGSGTSWFKDNADRPGYPVLAGLVAGITGMTPFDLAFVLPAAMGALIGVAAGVFAVRVLRESGWAFPVYAVAVGASVNVALTAVGLADNLIVDSLLMAAATPALLVTAGGGGGLAAILLLAGAALVHWPFTLLFLLMLGMLVAVLVPESVIGWRRGERVMATPAGRLAALVAGSALAVGGALALSPALPELPRAGRGQFSRKLRALLPLFRLPIAAVAATAGTVSLLVHPNALRRRGLVLLLIWAGSAVAAAVLLSLGVASAAHRILGFSLAIPLLGAAGLVGLVRLAHRAGRGLWPVAAAIVLAVLAGGAILAVSAWGTRARSWVPLAQLVQAQQAGAYLERVRTDQPVIFVINPFASRPGSPVELSFRVVRSGLPGEQVADTYVYLGDPAQLSAGEPTLRDGNEPYNKISLRHWRDVEPLLAQDPIVLLLPAFNEGLLEERRLGDPVAAGVLRVRGPAAPGWQPPVPSTPDAPSGWRMAGQLLLLLGLWSLTGLGWSVTALPLSWAERVALAPALGMAVLILGGVLAGRLGAGGMAGAAIPLSLAVAASGWIVPVGGRFRRRRRPRTSSGPPGQSRRAEAGSSSSARSS